jgi:hypothetical protein
MSISNNALPSSIFNVAYHGFSVLDFNFSTPAFRWIIGELIELVPFGHEDIEFAVATDDGKPRIIASLVKESTSERIVVLEHYLDHVGKFFLSPDNVKCFAYSVRTDPDHPSTFHAFCARNEEEVRKEILDFVIFYLIFRFFSGSTNRQFTSSSSEEERRELFEFTGDARRA